MAKTPRKKQSIEEIHQEKYHVEQTYTLDDQPQIKGFEFNTPVSINSLIKSFSTTGFQATNLASAIEITKAMQREKAVIFLSYTSNMVTSGCRDIIRWLVEHKKVDVLITSAGGVEEDIMKSLKPFALGQFDAPGKILFERGIHRTGNIFVPNDRYALFDIFMQPFFNKLYEQQKSKGKIITPHELNKELGLAINKKDSILYWAAKNDIPIFCPGLVDGSLGDLIVFFKQKHKDFAIDVTGEVEAVTRLTLNAEKTGVIALGGGISKHFMLNANVFRDGADYAVYINTAEEYDGCDSGAKTDEAVTWGKIKPHAPKVKVHCDATIAFPLLVAGSFIAHKK